MKYTLLSLISALILLFSSAFSALAEEYQTTTVKGTECYIYYVKQGEGFYSLNKKFGVTRDEVVKFNPSAKNGLNRGQKLYIPIPENAKPDASAASSTVHTVKQGESLYSISKQYNTTVSDIMVLNGMSSSALKAGDKLKIPQAGSNSSAATEKAGSDILQNATAAAPPEPVKQKEENIAIINGERYRTEKYVVQRRETLYSISQKFNTSIDNILACNPGIKSLSKGDILNIPMTKEVIKVVDEYRAANQPITVTPDRNMADADKKDKNHIKIAVLYPFRLNAPTHQSKAFLSCYKGLLLALDSMKHEGLSAEVVAFDTEGSIEKIKQILESPKLKGCDMIFGPDDKEGIKLIGEYAKYNQILLVNSFSINDNEVAGNRFIIQGHIPSSYFYSTASKALAKSAADKEVVFLVDNYETNDKKEFIENLREEFKASGKEITKFNFNDASNFNVLSNSLEKGADVIFIASSSTRNGVAKTTALLSKIKETRPDLNMSLFGYPEWLTYTKDYLEIFHNLNTTVFSRFYINTNDAAWKEFYRNFLYWYGSSAGYSLPATDVLGFDTGIFLLKGYAKFGSGLSQNISSLQSNSIQTDFSMTRISDNGGYINKNIYFVNFSPEFKISKSRVE